MKSKYIIFIGLLLVSEVSANALMSIGKALVIYTSKSAVVVKNVAPVVKVVPIKPIPNVIPPKVTPKMIPKSAKVNKGSKEVPNSVPKSNENNSIDNSPYIPNMSPAIIWNKLENDCKPNCGIKTIR